MAFLLAHLSLLAMGALFCLGWVVIAIAAAMVVHRFVDPAYLSDHREQAGFIYAVIGVVYAVILAFVAIGVWERFEAADVRTYDEATALVDVYRDAAVFPTRDHIRGDLRRYTELVLHDEWPKMVELQRSVAARDAIEGLAEEIAAIKPATMGQQNVHASMLAAMDRVLAERAVRVSMGATGLNPIVWVVIGSGAFVTVGFSFLFPFKRKRIQAIMVGALTFTIAIVFYLATAIDYPFRGDISIQPHAFENAIATYDAIDHLPADH